jgi:hypothetical protein
MKITRLASDAKVSGCNDPEPRWYEWAVIAIALLIMGGIDLLGRGHEKPCAGEGAESARSSEQISALSWPNAP